MRKGRVIAILCLSLILCFMCLITNTFSWFDRAEESGNTLVYRNKTLKQSSGKSFDVATYKQVDGGEYSEPLTNNTISKDAPLTLKAGERQCFKTQIKSNNTSKQNVSLYLSGVKSDDYTNTYVGVNNPMRTYKTVGAPESTVESKTKNENGIKDVYVGICGSDGYNPDNFKLHYWNSGDKVVGDADIKYLHSTSYKRDKDTLDVYHVEVPYDAIGVKVRQNGAWKGNNIDISTNNFVCLYLDSNHNYKDAYSISTSETPAGIEYFYSEASINVNGKIDLTASGNGDLVYNSDKPGIAKVVTDPDGKKVYVQGVSEGDATISVTSTGTVCDNQDGRKPDTQTFTCVVHVKPVPDKLPDIPVVTNMEISKYDSETDQNILTVYWYIKNTSSESINVSVDKINVTL